MRVLNPTNGDTLDRIGVVASCACVLHCALTPLLIAVVPLLSANLLADKRTEWTFVGMSFGIGFLSLLPAYIRRHKRGRPLVLFGAGLCLILIARLALEEKAHFELPVVIVGALLIVTSHVLNRKFCRSCVKCLMAIAMVLFWMNSYLPAGAAQETSTKDQSVAYFQQATRYFEARQYESAVAALKKAISLNPDFPAAYNDLATSYTALGRHYEAVETLQQAVRLKPNFAAAHNNLGSVYFQIGELELAQNSFRQAIIYNPHYALAFNNLGATLSEAGKHLEAIEAYEKALRLRPDWAEAHRNLASYPAADYERVFAHLSGNPLEA